MSSIASLHFEKGTATLKNRDKIDDGVAFEVENESFKYRVDKDGVHLNDTGYINGFDQDELTANKTSIPSSYILSKQIDAIYPYTNAKILPITTIARIDPNTGSITRNLELGNEFYNITNSTIFNPNGCENSWNVNIEDLGKNAYKILPSRLIVSDTVITPFYGMEWEENNKVYYSYYDAQENKFIRYVNGFVFYLITANGSTITQTLISRNEIRQDYVPKLCVYDANNKIFNGDYPAKPMNFEWVYDCRLYAYTNTTSAQQNTTVQSNNIDIDRDTSYNYKSIISDIALCRPAHINNVLNFYTIKGDISGLFATVDDPNNTGWILSIKDLYIAENSIYKAAGLFNNQRYLKFDSTVPLSRFNITGCTDTSAMFRNCSSASHIPFDLANMSSVENACDMFKYFNSYNDEPIDITFPDGAFNKLKYAVGMFYGANIRNLRLPSYFVPAGGLNVFNLTWNGRMNAMCDMFNDCKASSITGLENWDVSNVERFDSLFRRVINLESLPNVSKWDTSHVVNLHHAFYQDSDASKTKLADISAIANWNVSNVEDMWDTFCYCHKLTNLEAIRNWDVSKVQTLRGTFFKCSNLTSLEALSNWNTKSVTNLRSTFAGPSKFTSLHGLENWDTSNVTNMFETFRGNTQLTDISAISNWDVSNVLEMSGVFRDTGITNLDALENWDTSNVISLRNAFTKCPLTDISGIKNWDVSKVCRLNEIFEETTIDSGENGLMAIKDWNVSNVVSIDNLIKNCNSITNVNALDSWYDKLNNLLSMQSTFEKCSNLTDLTGLSRWNCANLASMNSTFTYCGFNSAALGALANFNTSNVIAMYNIFSYCPNITNLNGLANWNVSKVSSFASAFRECTQLTDINGLANWDVSNATTFGNMFMNDSQLTDISPLSHWGNKLGKLLALTYFLSDTNVSNLNPLSNWDVSNVAFFNGMFKGCKMANLSELANWDVSSAYTMSEMFYNATSLVALTGIENWNVRNAISFSGLFRGCTSLTDISALANWDTRNIVNTSAMFREVKMTNISALSNWNLSNNRQFNSMFYGCTELADISALANWDTSKALSIAHILRGTKVSDISPLANWNTSNVTNFAFTFYTCKQLTTITTELHNWDTNNGVSFDSMFAGCSNLTSLDISSFDFKKCTSTSGTDGGGGLGKFMGSSASSTSKLKTLIIKAKYIDTTQSSGDSFKIVCNEDYTEETLYKTVSSITVSDGIATVTFQ